MLDESFPALGTIVRVLREADGSIDLRAAFAEIEQRLSRFDPGSELARLNADPRAVVPASALLRCAVAGAVRAASLSGGLVDPTLLRALRRVGYSRSRANVVASPLVQALAAAPARRPAQPDAADRWRLLEIDDRAGTISRPPGLELDLGGSAKGWAADFIGSRLERQGRYAVDCGGDLRVSAHGGVPWEVCVRHPLTGGTAHTLHARTGGVATSGVDNRLWQRRGGAFAHHLIDPSSGEPAWTGLLTVTALARTGLEAEALAKAALLSGAAAARRLLRAHHGGVLVHDDGDVDVVV